MTLLDQDRPWLETQPSMRPWIQAKDKLAKQLEAWVTECGGTLFATPLTGDDADNYGTLACKLWECWKFHWKGECDVTDDGKADGMSVATRIRAGEGLRGGKLGGDVIHDVVWADGVLRGDTRATRSFFERFDNFAVVVARKVSPRYAQKLDWWDDLKASLVVRDNRPGKLANFQGQSGLEPWLGRAFAREIASYAQKEAKRAAAVDSFPGIADPKAVTADDSAIRRDCRERVQKVLRETLEALDVAAQQAIIHCFVDELENKESARIMDVSAGTATRRRVAALARMRDLLVARSRQDGDSLSACLKHMLRLGDDDDLGSLFANADEPPNPPLRGQRTAAGPKRRDKSSRGDNS